MFFNRLDLSKPCYFFIIPPPVESRPFQTRFWQFGGHGLFFGLRPLFRGVLPLTSAIISYALGTICVCTHTTSRLSFTARVGCQWSLINFGNDIHALTDMLFEPERILCCHFSPARRTRYVSAGGTLASTTRSLPISTLPIKLWPRAADAVPRPDPRSFNELQ